MWGCRPCRWALGQAPKTAAGAAGSDGGVTGKLKFPAPSASIWLVGVLGPVVVCLGLMTRSGAL